MTARSEDTQLTTTCDRFAATLVKHYAFKPKAVMFSIVASSSVVKTISAMINRASSRDSFSIDGQDFELHENGYEVKRQRLSRYDAVHAVFKVKSGSFFFGDQATGVKQYLLSNAIDSPILESWVPYITGKLLENKKVIRLNSYGISAYQCVFKSETVDEIVSKGIASNELKIAKENHAS